MKAAKLLWLVHHTNTSKDLRKYGETAGETFTHIDRPIAAFDTKEAADAHVTAEVAKITSRDKWNVRDVLAGGRGYGSKSKVATEIVKRGERHEFRVYSVDYYPAAVGSEI
jgi:hypothetical protein